MNDRERTPPEGPGALRYIPTPSNTTSAALQRVEDALDEGLDESFPASDPLAIDTRRPDQRQRIKEGLRAMHALDINCLVEYESFIIELNAELRDSQWFPEFQICKGTQVVSPWQAPATLASATKQRAIEAAAASAIADIRGGLATTFADAP
ncbi:hypothetical protein [Duganella sp. BuS-21]|uniref:hypothetical protein n=1 Tax=Duganella sp. BuS-21 TaxID=2943848 RepID=UPI0035A714F3